jgi:hypothetical protein
MILACAVDQQYGDAVRSVAVQRVIDSFAVEIEVGHDLKKEASQ